MEKLLKLTDIMNLTHVSKVTIYRWIKDGNFPAPRKLSKGSSIWPESEIQAWLDNKLKQRTD